VEILGKRRIYKLLEKVEFSSERKKMSIIVEDPEGNIILFSKGADVAILNRLT